MDKSVRIAIWLLGILLFIGTVLFHQLEGWSWVDSFYFTGVTLLTIGYGDLVPTQPLTKVLVVVLGFGAISTAVYTFSALGRAVSKKIEQFHDGLPFTSNGPKNQSKKKDS